MNIPDWFCDYAICDIRPLLIVVGILGFVVWILLKWSKKPLTHR